MAETYSGSMLKLILLIDALLILLVVLAIVGAFGLIPFPRI